MTLSKTMLALATTVLLGATSAAQASPHLGVNGKFVEVNNCNSETHRYQANPGEQWQDMPAGAVCVNGCIMVADDFYATMEQNLSPVMLDNGGVDGVIDLLVQLNEDVLLETMGTEPLELEPVTIVQEPIVFKFSR